ncbi:hypothetical protein [Alloactinosynnema sp. L-07]|uniref:hypothetical protein n=1 Tax=Alloactinosynnema sp. L-07 TaxID=1653480 RepID=UPI00065EF147|nr:hypothetical protein [Alloactinosynnema sp. L-07]CRK56966.1 hypothetical protein [Alloactinosynnema sp. L-07]
MTTDLTPPAKSPAHAHNTEPRDLSEARPATAPDQLVDEPATRKIRVRDYLQTSRRSSHTRQGRVASARVARAVTTGRIPR